MKRLIEGQDCSTHTTPLIGWWLWAPDSSCALMFGWPLSSDNQALPMSRASRRAQNAWGCFAPLRMAVLNRYRWPNWSVARNCPPNPQTADF
jgi:hypothetical protein